MYGWHAFQERGTENKLCDEAERYIADELGRILLTVLSPSFWIVATIYFFVFAKQLSFASGISRENRGVSNVTPIVVIVFLLAAIIIGVLIAAGGGIPVIGGGDDESETPTPATTPISTSEPIQTQTHKPTETQTPVNELELFEADFRERVNLSMERDHETGVPTLATEYRDKERMQLELWIVYWECDRLDSLKEQQVTVAASYTNAVGDFKGKKPDRLRVYGVTNLEQYNDTITYINTSNAEAVHEGKIDPDNFTENWSNRQRVPTSAESDTAYQMVVNESGEQLADEAFNQHHREIRGCPGGARDPTPPNGSNSDVNVSASSVNSAAEPIVP